MGRGRAEKSLDLVLLAHEILEQIQPASVRAVCYQLFVRGAIPGMDKASTNRVGALLTRAREEGEIPWEWIVQEGRAIESVAAWQDPAAFARSVQAAYRRNKWDGQPTRIMVVSEKGTVRGTLAPVLEEFEVEFLPVGGYASATRVKELADARTAGDKPLLLLYLGDHDPSGRGMSDQDLPRRLLRYLSTDRADKDAWDQDAVDFYAAEWGVDVRRIALTIEDTEALGEDLGFPAEDKANDPRYPWFAETFGSWCWELDALNPNILRGRVRDALRAELDPVQWARYVAAEQVERASITQTLDAWKSISGLARE
ncbi:MAG: hypothetical protein Q7W02_02340 [Candidatus Rokubacteria bacterium]|nr:hypothetical protein [Candidatus Rokubacteria bacterium]